MFDTYETNELDFINCLLAEAAEEDRQEVILDRWLEAVTARLEAEEANRQAAHQCAEDFLWK